MRCLQAAVFVMVAAASVGCATRQPPHEMDPSAVSFLQTTVRTGQKTAEIRREPPEDREASAAEAFERDYVGRDGDSAADTLEREYVARDGYGYSDPNEPGSSVISLATLKSEERKWNRALRKQAEIAAVSKGRLDVLNGNVKAANSSRLYHLARCAYADRHVELARKMKDELTVNLTAAKNQSKRACDRAYEAEALRAAAESRHSAAEARLHELELEDYNATLESMARAGNREAELSANMSWANLSASRNELDRAQDAQDLQDEIEVMRSLRAKFRKADSGRVAAVEANDTSSTASYTQVVEDTEDSIENQAFKVISAGRRLVRSRAAALEANETVARLGENLSRASAKADLREREYIRSVTKLLEASEVAAKLKDELRLLTQVVPPVASTCKATRSELRAATEARAAASAELKDAQDAQRIAQEKLSESQAALDNATSAADSHRLALQEDLELLEAYREAHSDAKEEIELLANLPQAFQAPWAPPAASESSPSTPAASPSVDARASASADSAPPTAQPTAMPTPAPTEQQLGSRPPGDALSKLGLFLIGGVVLIPFVFCFLSCCRRVQTHGPHG